MTPLPPGTVAATITAGWRAREPEDAELDRLLGGGTVNLRLYERWLDVLDRDHELAAAEVNHRAVAEELQELYALQVERANQAMDAIRRTATRPRTRDGALSDAEAALRLLDERHLDRMSESWAEFEAAWRPAERDPVARHRDRVRAELDRAGVLVLTGGHVGVLLHVLRLFAVTPPADVLAWSAGAMALTDRAWRHDTTADAGARPAGSSSAVWPAQERSASSSTPVRPTPPTAPAPSSRSAC